MHPVDRGAVRSVRYRGTLYKAWLAIFVVSFLVLGYLGVMPPSDSITNTGTGFTPHIGALKNPTVNDDGNPTIESPRVTRNTAPRITAIVPSVITNGCTRSPTIIEPFARPHTAPTRQHTPMPTGIDENHGAPPSPETEPAAEIQVLEAYLPQRLSPAQVADAVRALVAELGATGPGDMGRVMQAAKARLGSSAEMAAVSAAVKQALAGR